MKMREVKKRLALLLSAAMVFWMMPSSAFTALAAWAGSWSEASVWLKNVKMTPEKAEIQIREETTITVSADLASPSNAQAASPSDAEDVATPSDADEVLGTLTESEVKQSGEGSVSIVSVSEGIITVQGEKAGKVTLALIGTDASCIITVKDSDNQAIQDAKAAIESGKYSVAQATVQDDANNKKENELKQELVTQVNSFSGVISSGITISEEDITIVEFTPATAGTEDDPEGKDGSFSFKVSLKKGSDSADTVATVTSENCTITATESTVSNQDLVDKAKAAIEGGTYIVDQAYAQDESGNKNEEGLKQKLAEKISELEVMKDKEIKVEINLASDFNPAKNGDADEPKNTKDGSFKFTAEVTRGKRSATTLEISGTIKAKEFEGLTNAEAVEKAKTAIEAETYSFPQAEAGTEEALKSVLFAKIKGLSGVISAGVEVAEGDINVSAFQSAKEGDADTPEGTGGNFSFTVSLKKGKTASATTESKDGTITATPFGGTLTNEQAVKDAESAIRAAGTFVVDQAEAQNEDGTENEEALKEALVQKINVLDGVKDKEIEDVKITDVSDFVPAKAGTEENPDGKGTDGSFTFTAKITKGTHNAEIGDLKGTITAKSFDGVTNAQAVANARTAIEGGTYTFTQAEAGTMEDLRTALADRINALPGMSDTGITVTAENIIVDPFTPAEAGTADNLEGVNGSFTFTVDLVKGSASQTAGKTGTIAADAFIVTGFTFDKSRVTIDLTQAVETEVTVTPVMSGTPSAEQKEAIYQDFLNGKFKAELTTSDQVLCAKILETFINEDDLTVTLLIEGLEPGNATLRVSYGKLTGDCVVVVPKTDGPVVGAALPDVTLGDNVDTNTLTQQLSGSVEEGTSVPENAAEQVKQIIEVLSTTEPPFEANNLPVEEMLLEELPDAQVIILTPFVEIQALDLAVEGDAVIVKSMKTELKVEIDVDGQALSEEEVKDLLRKNGVYISMSVAVPERDARGGADYVEWTHYDGDQVDNSVIQDTVTKISDDNIATVRSKSFSPFDLTFVANDNDTYDFSDSDSSSDESAAAGQWKKAADGVRWWYENPDGTWPANGWAQLVWNGETSWYYFDAEGYMVTGWVTWEGNRYYLHPISDNTQGHMYTGWQMIEDKWYYFRPESGGPQGSLFVDGTTPDGRKVDANGVWIQ